MEKNCPECGDKIIGRADKKFCSDACRNAYNNALNKDSKKPCQKRKQQVAKKLSNS